MVARLVRRPLEGASGEGAGHFAELVLQRPPCNEIGREMLVALERALDELEREPPLALIIHSDVDAGFSAGADLRELYYAVRDGGGAQAQLEELRSFLERIHRVMNRLDALPVPTVGAVHGVCFGGGFELALTCDLLVADVTARFAFPELRLGLIPGFGGIPRLKRDLGNALVRDLLFTGRSINAKKALGVGLVSQVVSKGRALEVARATASRAAQFDPEVRALAKSFIKQLPIGEIEQEKAHFIRLFVEPRVLQALERFVTSSSPLPYV